MNQRLEELRKMLGLNQTEFGIYAGVSQRTASTWFTGERQIPEHVLGMLERLATYDAYKVAQGELTQPFLRWAVIDTDGEDEYIDVYGSKAEALRAGARDWKQLTEAEKKRRSGFVVGLINVQYSDDKRDHFPQAEAEDGSVDGTIYAEAKRWK